MRRALSLAARRAGIQNTFNVSGACIVLLARLFLCFFFVIFFFFCACYVGGTCVCMLYSCCSLFVFLVVASSFLFACCRVWLPVVANGLWAKMAVLVYISTGWEDFAWKDFAWEDFLRG